MKILLSIALVFSIFFLVLVNFKLVWKGESRYRLRFVIKGLLNKEDELLSLLKDGDGLGKIEVV